MNYYLSPVKIAGGEERFVCPQSLVLNTYLGCRHDCVYCYAKFILQPLGRWRTVTPADVNILNKILSDAERKRDMVSRLIQQRVPFRFANITDGFQDIEKVFRVSLEALKVLSRFDYPVIINTKGVIIAEPEYLEVICNMKVVVQMTLIWHQDWLVRMLEPHAPSATERLEALMKLADAGVITQVRFSPVFPMLNDEPEEFFHVLRQVKVKDVICEFVRLPLAKVYLEELNRRLGFDYLQMLRRSGYPIVKLRHWFKVAKPFIFDEYKRFKRLAEREGLNFYVCCEEQPQINNWANCCGTDKYEGFENCMSWTIQMNGKRFLFKKEVSFEEYVEGFDIPYLEQFRRYWMAGKLEGSIYGLRFNRDRKTYSLRSDYV
ncbi:MAG: radical SAM protein [Candidatus Bathyarchaeia archaeon]